MLVLDTPLVALRGRLGVLAVVWEASGCQQNTLSFRCVHHRTVRLVRCFERVGLLAVFLADAQLRSYYFFLEVVVHGDYRILPIALVGIIVLPRRLLVQAQLVVLFIFPPVVVVPFLLHTMFSSRHVHLVQARMILQILVQVLRCIVEKVVLLCILGRLWLLKHPEGGQLLGLLELWLALSIQVWQLVVILRELNGEGHVLSGGQALMWVLAVLLVSLPLGLLQPVDEVCVVLQDVRGLVFPEAHELVECAQSCLLLAVSLLTCIYLLSVHLLCLLRGCVVLGMMNALRHEVQGLLGHLLQGRGDVWALIVHAQLGNSGVEVHALAGHGLGRTEVLESAVLSIYLLVSPLLALLHRK